MTLPQQTEADRRKGFRRMRLTATLLLVIMAGVLLIARFYEASFPWLAWVRVFAEASLVGGLADWFAVTALFRHPCGVPIPHTAIIPARKDRLAKTIGDFFQSNFLSGPVFQNGVKKFDAAERFLKILADPRRAERFCQTLLTTWTESSDVFGDKVLRDWFSQLLLSVSKTVRLSPLVGRTLGAALTASESYPLVEDLLRAFGSGVSRHRAFLEELVGKEIPWYLPQFVQRKIYKKVLSRLEQILEEMREDPNHELRRRIISELSALASRLESSPELIAKGEEFKATLLSSPSFSATVNEIWKEIISPDARRTETPSFIADLSAIVATCAQKALEDPSLRLKLSQATDEVLLRLAARYGREMGGFIERTVNSWDTDTIVDKLEVNVGRDLQYIRLNGTLVGGLVGLAIHALLLLIK